MHKMIINVISGKGGTGKTLLSAVLAEMLGNIGNKVLVVDLDVFVRGLTALLYFQQNEVLKIIKSNDLSVSEFFYNKGLQDKQRNVSILRYRSFDVLPSVASVDEVLYFNDIMPNSLKEAKKILFSLLDYIPEEYDYIFLDSRAGYDELISATHQISNFSICVEEDDNISMITSENLIAQLKNVSQNPILRIKNKTRKYNIKKDDGSFGISYVGNIPFDSDIMNSFGTKDFWENIRKSIYKDSLISVWNSISKKMNLDMQLKENRISPLGNKRAEQRLSILSTFNRIMFSNGIIITLLSFYVTIGGNKIFARLLYEEPIRLLGIIMSLFGITLTITSVMKNDRK